MTFETVRLGDVVLFNPRESIKKGVIAKKIDMSVLQPFTRDVPSYELLEYKGGTKFRNGDTIMARITPCLENGKTAKVNVLEKNEVGFGSTEYIVFRAINGISDEDFVYYLVCSPIVREPAIKSMVGSSGRQRVQTDVLQNLEINLPDLETQRIIGSILRGIDDRISLNTAINENLEQQAQAYFVDLFITNADPNWRIGTISDLGNVVGGGTPSKKVEEYYTSDGIAWITPKDLSNDKSKFVAHGETDITELGLAKSSATLMPKGTVLFSSRAPIGYIAIADGQVCTNQGFRSIVPFDNVGTAFVYYFLKENLSAIENVASGSTFKEVSGSTMKNFTAIIPDNDTLAEFQRFCSPLFEQQRALEYENRYLSSIRDTLLPKLMNGEIDVSAVKI